MSGVIFNFFISGPKRVEFPIGIIDYGSQCNMLYWMYYHSDLRQRPLEKWTKHFQLGKTPRAPFLVDGSLHYIFKNFTVARFKPVFRITRSFPQNFDKITNQWPATTISK